MKNIFYFKSINKIGGTEQFLYEVAKKYKDWDITVYYDEADIGQIQRLQRFVRCKKHIPGVVVKCEKAFFNFNDDMINDVDAKEYWFVSHAIYQVLGVKPPIDNPKFTHYMGVSDYASKMLVDYGKKLKKDIKVSTCYDPLSLEKVDKVPILVTACRLDDVVKGGGRTLKLIEALDEYCAENGRNYLFLIFTNPNINVNLSSPNVVLMKPRVDVRPYIAMADWVIQVSDDMETFCYTVNEALGYGVPVITTPLSVMEELNVDDNMRVKLEYDCSNIKDVVKQIFEKDVKPFKHTPPKDSWDKFLAPGESTYGKDDMVRVQCKIVDGFWDCEAGKHRKYNEIWTTSLENAIRLENFKNPEDLKKYRLIDIID